MNRKTFLIQLRAQIANAILEHPELTYTQIGSMFGVGYTMVGGIARANKIFRKKGRGSTAWPKEVRHE